MPMPCMRMQMPMPTPVGYTRNPQTEIETMGVSLVAFAQQCLDIFQQLVLADPACRAAIEGSAYYHETYYAGLVDPQGKVNFYDGQVRVVDPTGSQLAQYDAADYLDHVAERVEPWSYLKFPYLKQVGWQGLRDGADSGVYRVNALARLNVADGMATPLAQAAYQALYDHFGGKPVHHTLAFHWARLVENLFACEEILRLVRDPEIVSPEVRVLPSRRPSEGVGVVEAARGTLFHHYKTDPNGMVKEVNLIVATVQNNAAMNMSVKKAAQACIQGGVVNDGILDRVEMAFRAYDPCLACATHTLPGRMPMVLRVHRADGEVQRFQRS